MVSDLIREMDKCCETVERSIEKINLTIVRVENLLVNLFCNSPLKIRSKDVRFGQFLVNLVDKGIYISMAENNLVRFEFKTEFFHPRGHMVR